MTRDISQFDRAMAMWREIDFPLIEPRADELPFVTSLATMYGNGEVLHKSFAMPDHPDLADFINSGALHSTFFFERFWQTKSVANALPYALANMNFFDPEIFRVVLPVHLPASMAEALVRGGAYTAPMSGRSAMERANQAAESLLNGDFDNPSVFVSHASWSEFFLDVAWDYTWLIIRPADKRIEVVMATDAD